MILSHRVVFSSYSYIWFFSWGLHFWGVGFFGEQCACCREQRGVGLINRASVKNAGGPLGECCVEGGLKNKTKTWPCGFPPSNDCCDMYG